MKELIFLEPVLKDCVWGGKRLVTEFPYRAEGKHIGECWAVSAHPHGDCVIREGAYAGKTLSQLYRDCRELFGGLAEEQFPLLVKIIDAREDLSIQVHPNDAYAREHEDCPFGKTECWYVLDCPENASLIIGHHAGSREELRRMISQGHYRELIREVPVKKGDFLQIEPGTVHAIKGGFLILETQQSSDITYRVYDYDRVVDGKPRQLHVRQSIDVINVPDESDRIALQHAGELQVNRMRLLVECECYKVWKLNLRGEFSLKQDNPFMAVSVLEGSGTIDGHSVAKGSHLLIPFGYGNVGFSGEMELILSTVPDKTAKN